jgi:hypothetical protein
MHDHEHEHADGAAESAAHVRSTPTEAALLAAAAHGRTDVMGPAGLLGVQRTAGNAAATELVEEQRSPVLDVVGSGGQSMDEGVRTDMEARLGHDFSDVRLHTDDRADSSARSVSADAYTVGSDIVFQRGAYDPGSAAGQTLLAHELTHVVQQRSGPVDGTSAGGGIAVSSPSDRFEREAAANADRVMSQPAPVQTATAAPAAPAVAIQREAAPEEDEEVQASHDPSLGPVQREAAEEEVPEEAPQG